MNLRRTILESPPVDVPPNAMLKEETNDVSVVDDAVIKAEPNDVSEFNDAPAHARRENNVSPKKYKCSCKTGCKAQCGCKKRNLACNEACYCKINCQNQFNSMVINEDSADETKPQVLACNSNVKGKLWKWKV